MPPLIMLPLFQLIGSPSANINDSALFAMRILLYIFIGEDQRIILFRLAVRIQQKDYLEFQPFRLMDGHQLDAFGIG